jgi:hypothetical protein
VLSGFFDGPLQIRNAKIKMIQMVTRAEQSPNGRVLVQWVDEFQRNFLKRYKRKFHLPERVECRFMGDSSAYNGRHCQAHVIQFRAHFKRLKGRTPEPSIIP